MKLENPRSWCLHARRTFSRMAPRKPDTMELLPVSTRPEIGRGDPTAPVYHRYMLSLLRVLPPMARLSENHSSKQFFQHRHFPSRPPPRSVRCYPLFPRFAPILTVSLITGAIRVGWTVLVHLTTFWRFEVARRLETVWSLWRRGGNLARLGLLSKWTDT